jgi:HD-GYP domain-containing protein (c-di-GMP phosphodiesterase class II)
MIERALKYPDARPNSPNNRMNDVDNADIERARARHTTPSARAELRAALILLAAFVGGAVVLQSRFGAPGAWWWMLGVLAVLYAVAGLVEFEVGTVHTDCSVAVLAMMLVALPPAVIPWCVAAGALLNAVVKVVHGARHASRVVPAVAARALPSLAPAAVLALLEPGSTWTAAPAIGCALAAYVVADLGVSIGFGRLAYSERLALPSVADAWVYAIDMLLAPLGVAIGISAQGRAWALALAFLPLAGLLRVFASERRTRIDQALELSQAYRGTAMLLGDMVETDDAYTGSHSRDVVELAVEVGRRLGLGPDALRDLEFGALLHDVGKIVVPNEIINKPGRLTPEEWEIMKRHTTEGQRMLQNIGGVLGRVGVIVRASHEDYDGTGYPDGLAGTDIPIEARICSACDALSAMTTDRSYRTAMSLEDAVTELRRCAGTQFDPEVVATLIEIIEHNTVSRVKTAAPALPVPVGNHGGGFTAATT